MFKRSRIRRSVKWLLVAVVVMLVVVQAWSWVYAAAWWRPGGPWVLHRGAIQFSRVAVLTDLPGDRRPVVFRSRHPLRWVGWDVPGYDHAPWVFIPFDRGDRFRTINLPLWLPTALALGGLLWLRRNDRRRERLAGFVCLGCGYDRAGLAEGAACPECGASDRS